ncbi:FimV/HubP family polar landmark protein [Thioalkalicoccus limnaeus]|uniref:FimV/HubP family polar landmark protein n=1 Tax=Thioalkalicoccus limnaeus TaxID=120681 RepID=A0ABV4BFH4_9GAMM
MFRRIILASAVSLALLPGGVSALGLGELRTDSGLNQPFVGEIELVDARSDELDTIKAVLASEGEFRRAGAERHYFLTGLRFEPWIAPDGRTVLRVTSREPIREPFVNFLVELNWPAGRLVREYTVLLDPPTIRERRAVARPTPVTETRRGAPAVESDPDRPLRAAPPRIPAGVDATAFPLLTGPVPSGSGLLQMARRLDPPGATTAQTALALYRNNPDAFIAGDINRLRLGERLVIPSAAELFALDAATAERDLAAAIRGQPVARAPLTVVTDPPASDDARLRIATPTEAPAPSIPAPSVDGPAPSRVAELERELLLVREENESTRQETAELQTRIRQLEEQLTDIQALLILRDEQLAELRLAEALAAEPRPAQPGEGLPPHTELPRVQVEPDVLPPPDDSLPIGLDQGVLALPDEMSPVTADRPESVLEGASPPADDEPVRPEVPPVAPQTPDDAPVSATEPAPAPVMEAVESAAPVATSPADSPTRAGIASPLGLGAALAVVIGLGSLYLIRRRRRLEVVPYADHGLPPDEVVASTPPPATEARGSAGAPAAAPAPSPAGPDISPDSTLRLSDEESEVDVFSEADIYIAYGRYREAETLLRDEISRAPARLDLKFKLAEALFGMKDIDSLVELIDAMKVAGAEESSPEQWRRVTMMLSSLRKQSTSSDGEPSGRSEPPGATPPATAMTEPPGGAGEATGGSMAESNQPRVAAERPVTPTPSSATPRTEVRTEKNSFAQPREPQRVPPLMDLDLDLDDLIGSVSDRANQSRGGGQSRVPPRPAPKPDRPQGPDLTLDVDADQEWNSINWEGREGQPEPRRPKLDKGGASQREVAGAAPAKPTPLDLDLGDLLVSADEIGRRPEGSSGDRSGHGSKPGARDEAPLDPFSFSEGTESDFAQSSSLQRDTSPWDEVSTKLDLARAYLEMQDPDAARTILDEVAEEGTDAQRAEARQLLAQIK